MHDAVDESHASGPEAPPQARQTLLDTVRDREHPDCIMCGTANPLGMKLKFRVIHDGAVLASFPCRDMFQSYPETLHGGVISALLDAAMTNALFSQGIVAVTAELSVRFLSPVMLNRSAVVTASVTKAISHHLYYVSARLQQAPDIMAQATGKFLAKGRKLAPPCN